MPLSAASVPSELELSNVDQGPKEIFEDMQLCFYSVKQKQIVFINALMFGT